MLLYAGLNIAKFYPDITIINHSGLLYASLEVTANKKGLEELIRFLNDINISSFNQIPIGINQAHNNLPFAKFLINPDLEIHIIPSPRVDFADRLIGNLLYSPNRYSFVLAQLMRVGGYYHEGVQNNQRDFFSVCVHTPVCRVGQAGAQAGV